MANPKADFPFCTIESAQEYMALLADTIVEASNDIEGQITATAHSSRHTDALRIALYNLHKLDRHIRVSRRALNDLRTLRRLIGQERAAAVTRSKSARATVSSEEHSVSVDVPAIGADEIRQVA